MLTYFSLKVQDKMDEIKRSIVSVINLLHLNSKSTLLCSVILEMDPVNISVLPAGTVLGFVSRGTGDILQVFAAESNSLPASGSSFSSTKAQWSSHPKLSNTRRPFSPLLLAVSEVTHRCILVGILSTERAGLLTVSHP